jgi:integrase/recombinase XerD
MTTPRSLPTLLRAFFQDYLAAQRDLSPNTIMAYRDTFKLFLQFAAKHCNRQIIHLDIENLGPATVRSFLDHLEGDRRNCVATRNYRLVAIHRFFTYAATCDPTLLHLCQRVMDVPIKKTHTCPMTYLERNEIQAVLASPNRSQPLGLRDLALLTFLYNTGARVSELVALDASDVRLESPAQVRILGKGRKQRWCPLWAETTTNLSLYLQQRKIGDQSSVPLFVNARGQRITRHGINVIIQRHVAAASLKGKKVSPHTVRHTAAMHLLQAGVELNVIRAWLGHVSITTTSQYIEIDMKMKHEALKRCEPPVAAQTGRAPWHSRNDIIQWLRDL